MHPLSVRSLSVRLILAFLVVSLLGTALVALLVNWQTRREFDSLVQEIYQEDLSALHDDLTAYYAANGTWAGVETALFAPPPPDQPDRGAFRLPVTLVDAGGRFVYGSHRYEPGELLPADRYNQGLAITVDDVTVGWLTLDLFGDGRADFADSPEARFLANLNRFTLWSAVGVGAVALLLGIWLARAISYPIGELKAATKAVAQGELGAQVAIRSADEIGQLGASFNQMSADLARSNELRRQMTADIAHDLRTPLSVIQGYTEALDDGKLSGNSEIFSAMHKQVKHLNRLVEDLRTLSLADAGQLSLHPQRVAPRDLLEHSLLVYAPEAEKQQVSLHLEIAEDLPDIHVDPDRIVQVLGNLIGNALRHTPAGGQIRLRAAADGPRLVLQVQDTGSGIAAADLPHVFDRFYRGDKARADGGESGLGLAIARSIVAAHHGQITAASRPAQGTIFTITLPASPPA